MYLPKDKDNSAAEMDRALPAWNRNIQKFWGVVEYFVTRNHFTRPLQCWNAKHACSDASVY